MTSNTPTHKFSFYLRTVGCAGEDGAPSALGKPTKSYRLYVYPGIITSSGARPRSFGTVATSGLEVVQY